MGEEFLLTNKKITLALQRQTLSFERNFKTYEKRIIYIYPDERVKYISNIKLGHTGLDPRLVSLIVQKAHAADYRVAPASVVVDIMDDSSVYSCDPRLFSHGSSQKKPWITETGDYSCDRYFFHLSIQLNYYSEISSKES